MGSKLRLTMACGDYDRTRPLASGSVRPQDIELNVVCLPSPERHHRMLKKLEFDVCELSLASYFIGREQKLPLVAIPVFPHRRFRHGYIFVNQQAGIRNPKDLEGKRVGVRRFQNTASVWVRGILADEYGVRRESIQWFTEGEEELEVDRPPLVRRTRVPAGKTLDSMLAQGDLDAVIYPEALPTLRASSGPISRLFPDYKSVEQAYFRSTGIFPIMHTVVIKKEVVDQYPWVARAIWEAFEAAKAECYRYWSDERRSFLAWFGHAFEEQRELLGSDPWPYNLADNEKALMTLGRYLVEDGLLASPPVLKRDFLDVGR